MDTEEAKELQKALMRMELEFGKQLAVIIEKVDQFTNTAKKLDVVEDIAKDAATSTKSAHKRLDELNVSDIRSRLDKAEVRISDQDRRITALTGMLWGLGTILLGAIIKITFDAFMK